MIDVVVVGSGTSGVNAAAPLVDAGLRVTLLDFGNEDQRYAPLIPPKPFREIRQTDEQQHRYFLGDAFEGIPFDAVRAAAQLTPPRLHIREATEALMPVESRSFTAVESLAVGGLAAGWGAAVFPFDDDELGDVPLSRAELEPHYEAVADRIGVSGARDDLRRFFGDGAAMMPPLEVDSNAEVILSQYTRRRPELNRAGFYLGQTRLAICSHPHRGRGPHQYHDMEFWTDADRSVYRPQWTLEELKERPNFAYLNQRFVLNFAETGAETVEIVARQAASGQIETHQARALVLAAGTLSTARIVLRSFGRYELKLPLVCNPYTYVPVVNIGMLGRAARADQS